MPAVGTELLLILGLLSLNGLLAMSEMAMVTARKLRLHQRAEQGDAGAAAALVIADDPGRFLSTVQIGITAVGILAGAFGGATLTKELEALLSTLPPIAPYREALSFGLVVLAITYISLIIGELVPKQVALAHPERIAALAARPMNILSRLAAPAVWLLIVSSGAVLRLLRVQPQLEEVLSADEIKLLIKQGAHSGAFETVEQDLVEGAMALSEERVQDLMTPRPRIVWLDVDDPPADNWRKIAATSHTSFPVCQGDVNTVLGIVSIKQLWERQGQGESADLHAMPLTPPIFVMDRQPAIKLFDVFQTQGARLAMVMDERGGVKGVVTLTDLVEAIVGSGPLFGKGQDHQPVARDDGSYLLDGLMPLDEVKETLGLTAIPGEDDARYQSLGGLVFAMAGKVPTTGDAVEYDQWRFEVVDMDGRRIDKVLAIPCAAAQQGPE